MRDEENVAGTALRVGDAETNETETLAFSA